MVLLSGGLASFPVVSFSLVYVSLRGATLLAFSLFFFVFFPSPGPAVLRPLFLLLLLPPLRFFTVPTLSTFPPFVLAELPLVGPWLFLPSYSRMLLCWPLPQGHMFTLWMHPAFRPFSCSSVALFCWRLLVFLLSAISSGSTFGF